MTQPSHQRERDGVGNLGANQASCDQRRVEQEERNGAQRASPDGSERYHDAQYHTRQDSQGIEATITQMVMVTGMPAGKCLQTRFEQDSEGGEDQYNGQALLDNRIHGCGVGL